MSHACYAMDMLTQHKIHCQYSMVYALRCITLPQDMRCLKMKQMMLLVFQFTEYYRQSRCVVYMIYNITDHKWCLRVKSHNNTKSILWIIIWESSFNISVVLGWGRQKRCINTILLWKIPWCWLLTVESSHIYVYRIIIIVHVHNYICEWNSTHC